MKFTNKKEIRDKFKGLLTDEEIEAKIEKDYADLPEEPEKTYVDADGINKEILDHSGKIDEHETRVDDLEETVNSVKNMIESLLEGYQKSQSSGVIVGNEREMADETLGYHSLTEFAVDVRSATVGAKNALYKTPEKLVKADEIAKKYFTNDIETKAPTGMGIQDDAEGGFLVPPQFANQVLMNAIEQANLLGKTTRFPMTTSTLKLPYLDGFDHSSGQVFGGVQFYWIEEAGTLTNVNPKLGQLTLDLKKLGAIIPVTSELLKDSPISIEPMFNKMMSQGLAWTLDYVFLNGVGAGQPLGVLESPALIAQAAEDAQTPDTIKTNNITNMWSRQINKNSCVWIANHDTFPELSKLEIVVGTGGSVAWLPANSGAGSALAVTPPMTLMGRPIIFSEHVPTLGDQGDIGCYDFSQYVVGTETNGGLRTDISIHLYFTTDQTAFRFLFRIDGKPWWSGPLTPRTSSTTLSPFVTLAERA